MEKSVKATVNAREILNSYLANKNFDELKALFSAYQTQVVSAELEANETKIASLVKGFSSFNLVPLGGSNRYLSGVELDDQQALCSDWTAVGEDLSAAWLKSYVKEAV